MEPEKIIEQALTEVKNIFSDYDPEDEAVQYACEQGRMSASGDNVFYLGIRASSIQGTYYLIQFVTEMTGGCLETAAFEAFQFALKNVNVSNAQVEAAVRLATASLHYEEYEAEEFYMDIIMWMLFFQTLTLHNQIQADNSPKEKDLVH